MPNLNRPVNVPLRLHIILMILLASTCSSPRDEVLTSVLEPYVGDVPGLAYAVVADGRLVASGASGLARMDSKEPVTLETNFRLASVTKQFTAAAVLRLIEDNALELENSLTDLFPGFPAYGAAITVRHLLTHTSGVLDYEDLIPDTATVAVHDADVLQMMHEQDSTYFQPGTSYRYSNTGYALLAMIVEARSGRSFIHYLDESIFKPAGMQNSVAFRSGVNEVERRALGYTVDADSITLSDQSLTSAVLGDGGIYSSISDLLSWDRALYTDDVLSAAMREAAMTPSTLSDGSETEYGFGWRIDEYRGRRRVHHTGSTSGFRTVIKRFPDDRAAVVVLTNRRDPSVSDVADRLADEYLFKHR